MRAVRHLIFALLASAACSGESRETTTNGSSTPDGRPSVHIAVNPAASFGAYRTFSFGPAEVPLPGYHLTTRSEEAERQLPPLITAALVQKGYVLAPVMGDLVIVFGAGRRDATVQGVSKIRGAGWLPDDESEDFREGGIDIDVFQSADDMWVWHGASRVRVRPGEVDAAGLRRSVHDLLAPFPPAGGGAPRASR